MGRTLTRKEKQARTRSCLLHSATKLICRKGINDASVEDIATDAGYTKGAFYANFKSKEEMFLVMLDEKYAAELERIEASLPGEGLPDEEVRRSAEDFIQFAWADSEWPKLYIEFTTYAARNPEFREELATRNRAMRERIAQVIEAWAEDFPADSPYPYEDIAQMLHWMVDGFFLARLVEPELSVELYGTMVSTFFRGIGVSALGLDPEGLMKVRDEVLAKRGG